ncbi:MAG: hypothetical protein WC306_03630 [Candidatus Paceibacterota bacterium]|jgi:hypothetical protein
MEKNMASLIAKIIDLILRGKSKELLSKMQQNPELVKATEEVDKAIKNLSVSVAKWEKTKKDQDL